MNPSFFFCCAGCFAGCGGWRTPGARASAQLDGMDHQLQIFVGGGAAVITGKKRKYNPRGGGCQAGGGVGLSSGPAKSAAGNR